MQLVHLNFKSVVFSFQIVFQHPPYFFETNFRDIWVALYFCDLIANYVRDSIFIFVFFGFGGQFYRFVTNLVF